MKTGDLVLIDYVGRQGGDIFDLSNEERAKEEGLYNEDMDYGPVPVLIGEGYVIEGLEEALEDMNVGEEKETEIPSGKAYGKRSSDKIETYPEKEFKKQDVSARPGERVMIGNRQGRILSRSSGRVKVDFNHPLSGKDLEYEVKVIEKVNEDEEKAEKIFDYRLGHGEIRFEDQKIIIDHDIEGHDHELPENVKDEIRDEILEFTDFEEVTIEN